MDYQSGRRVAPVCYKHQSYKGLKAPRSKCARCQEVFEYRSLTTVGVKFVGLPGKVYTYLVKRDHSFVRGDEAVVDAPSGPALVIVVRIDGERQDYGPFQYKQVRAKVVPL